MDLHRNPKDEDSIHMDLHVRPDMNGHLVNAGSRAYPASHNEYGRKNGYHLSKLESDSVGVKPRRSNSSNG